jgi:hypothetical protein
MEGDFSTKGQAISFVSMRRGEVSIVRRESPRDMGEFPYYSGLFQRYCLY